MILNLIKYNKKTIIIIFLTVLIIGSSFISTTNAQSKDELTDTYPCIAERLKEFFKDKKYDKIQIYNKDNQDISIQFYNENYNHYINNDMNTILENFLKNAENLAVDEIDNSIQAYENTNVSKRSRVLYTILKIKGKATSSEFGYQICGRASFNETTGKYVSISPPGISVYYYPGTFDSYKYQVIGDYGYKNNKRKVYYKNIVITMWATSISDRYGTSKVYFDPIYSGETLEF